MPNGDEVQFKSPTTGTIQAVPPEHWDEALNQGYKPTSHVVMYSPDGQRGMVPLEQARQKMQAGFRVQPETQFEKDRPGIIEGGLRNLNTPLPRPPGGGEEEELREGAPVAEEGLSTIGMVGAPISMLKNPRAVIPIAKGLARTFIGGAAGGAAGGYAGRELGNVIGKPEEGRRVGAALGGLAGGIVGGAYPDAFPSEGRLGSLFNRMRPEEPPTFPGASLPSADEFYGKRGAELNSMRKLQPGAFAPPGPELGSPDNPGFYAKLPARMPKPATVAPELGSPENPGLFSKIPTGVSSMPKPVAGSSAAPTIIRPSTTGEPLFSGSEGRAATWTNQDVMRLAGQGNREAIQQAVRRGMQLPANARYVMGDPDISRSIYNPRESTTFTPEGVPIRNRANPGLQNPSSRALIAPAGSPYAPPVEAPEIGSPYGPPSVGVSDNGYSRSNGNGNGAYAPIEPSTPMDPREVAEYSDQLGRPVSAEEIPDIRRRLEAERNVNAGLAGNRTDVTGNIREAHRAKLEKKGRI